MINNKITRMAGFNVKLFAWFSRLKNCLLSLQDNIRGQVLELQKTY
jgi:hypothetical protein